MTLINRNENNLAFTPLNLFRLALGFATSGFWMAFQAVTNRLRRTDYRKWLATLGASFFAGMVWDMYTYVAFSFGNLLQKWFWMYLLINGLWFLYREWEIKETESLLRSSMGAIQKMGKETQVANVGDDVFFIPAKPVSLTNDEAYEQYETHFPHLIQMTDVITCGRNLNLYPLKDYIRDTKDKVEVARYNLNMFSGVNSFETNHSVRTWLGKAKPHFIGTAPEFFEETMEMIDRLQKERDRNQKGTVGELHVQEYLVNYEDEFQPLYGNRFQTNEGTVENDALLFTRRGIFSLEIKNINSKGKQKLKISRDGQWFEWRKDQWKRSYNNSIFDQVNRHTVLTEKKLMSQFSEAGAIQVFPIIVIPNDNVEIINESQFEVMRPSQVPAYIRNQPIFLQKDAVEKMREYIAVSDIGQGRFEFLDVKAYVDEIEKRVLYIRQMEDLARIGNEICETYSRWASRDAVQDLIYLREINFIFKKPII